MVSGGCLCRKILSMYFNISLGVVYSLPSWSRGKTLAANAGDRGFKPHRGQKFDVISKTKYEANLVVIPRINFLIETCGITTKLASYLVLLISYMQKSAETPTKTLIFYFN